MKGLLKVAGAGGAALAVIAVAVGPLHDTGALVSPPEAVAEQFMRQVANGHYDVAIERAADRGASRVADLRRQGDRLRVLAPIIDRIDGEPGTIAGDTATASALIHADGGGTLRWRFTLARQSGVWKVTGWTPGETIGGAEEQ
jgi:hypothetical protein